MNSYVLDRCVVYLMFNVCTFRNGKQIVGYVAYLVRASVGERTCCQWLELVGVSGINVPPHPTNHQPLCSLHKSFRQSTQIHRMRSLSEEFKIKIKYRAVGAL